MLLYQELELHFILSGSLHDFMTASMAMHAGTPALRTSETSLPLLPPSLPF